MYEYFTYITYNFPTFIETGHPIFERLDHVYDGNLGVWRLRPQRLNKAFYDIIWAVEALS